MRTTGWASARTIRTGRLTMVAPSVAIQAGSPSLRTALASTECDHAFGSCRGPQFRWASTESLCSVKPPESSVNVRQSFAESSPSGPTIAERTSALRMEAQKIAQEIVEIGVVKTAAMRRAGARPETGRGPRRPRHKSLHGRACLHYCISIHNIEWRVMTRPKAPRKAAQGREAKRIAPEPQESRHGRTHPPAA